MVRKQGSIPHNYNLALEVALEVLSYTGTLILRIYDVCILYGTCYCDGFLWKVFISFLLRHVATRHCWPRRGTSVISSGIASTCTFCTGTASECVSVLQKIVAITVSISHSLPPCLRQPRSCATACTSVSQASSGTNMSTCNPKTSVRGSVLVDVMQMAPTLLQSLGSAEVGTLSATCRQLRRLVHRHATKITIVSHCWDKSYDTRCPVTELQVLANGGWPCLRCLNVQYHARLETGAIRHLTTASWSSLASLDLSRNSLGADAVSQLVLGKWPSLSFLNLSYSNLNSDAMTLLSKAEWPLEILKLSGNRIRVEGMQELIQGSWPKLTQISLQQSEMNADVIKVLATAWWPLQQLDLSYNALDNDAALAMTEVARGKWPELKELKLAGNLLSAQAIENLCQANWPHLASLDLSKCGLNGAEIAGLCRLPGLRLLDLDLTGNQLNKLSMAHLVKSDWPALKYLRLGGNFLDEAAVKTLLRKTWQGLEFLDCKFNFELTQDAVALLRVEHRFQTDY